VISPSVTAWLLYLDTSALAKLVRGEPETAALTEWITGHGGARCLVTSELGHAEMRRMLHRIGADADETEATMRLLDATAKIRLTRTVVAMAGDLAPGTPLRSLDAIHAASALVLGAACRSFVTYDKRQADSARLAGLNVDSPE